VWGDVTPAERLRAVTRRTVADHALAAEAAEALAGFAAEPASLVVACRRVLAHHPAQGALWWVCARILAAAEPAAAAREARRLLDADRTANRLAATLPLLDEEHVVASVGWPRAVDEALAERQDLGAVAVRVDGCDPTFDLRRRRTERNVRVLDPWDAGGAHVSHLLVPAAAIGPATALVAAGVTQLLDELAPSTREIWLVGGVGRVLPARLYDAALAATRAPDTDVPERAAYDEIDDPAPEICSLERFDRVAGPRGVEPAVDATARPDCPIVPELLRPLR
jgi:hypothetical protein